VNLHLTADEVLSTTRAVRKRLDFDRPVPREVILECLELAVQAPTGSNTQGWQWMFVEDDAKKLALRDLYRQSFEPYVNSPGPVYAEGDSRGARQEAVKSSAQYLSDNFHRAPVLMVPLIEGRLDGLDAFGAASMWGSILPAVWSFMLAARERGLGTAWTTLHLPKEREAAEILGIPYDRYTQAGLFPIAYSIGTDFKPAKRIDLEAITHWDSF
jgi:nitroreductase